MKTQHGRSATKATPSPPSDGEEVSLDRRTWIAPAHEPSFGARPVSGRSGSDSLLVPEPSPSRRLHSDPLRAGTSRAPDAGGFRGASRDKSSERSLLGERAGNQSCDAIDTVKLNNPDTPSSPWCKNQRRWRPVP